MKYFACGAVIPGCDATFAAADEAGILDQVASHAREHHGLQAVPPPLVEQVRAGIADRQ